MKKQLRDKWIAALRGGKYKQAKGALRTDLGHCCMGVLCDLIDPNAWSDKDAAGFYVWGDDRVSSNLPIDMQAKLKAKKHADWLPSLNDRGMSFEEIADLIESDDEEAMKAAR
jgi:hypothetical protein